MNDKQAAIINWLSQHNEQTPDEIANGVNLSKFVVCVVLDGLLRNNVIEKTTTDIELNGQLYNVVAYKIK